MCFSNLIKQLSLIIVLITLTACTGSVDEISSLNLDTPPSAPDDKKKNNNSPKVSATLNWTIPTTNTDNTPLGQFSGYKIYYGTSPNSLTNTLNVDNMSISEFVVENLTPNTKYYFAITTLNNENIESALSNIVNINI